MITAKELREILDYNVSTGDFLWRRAPCQRMPAASRAGWVENTGYVRIKILGRSYVAHRLAWLWVHGEWPAGPLDHINGNMADNRISNLRIASSSENARNRKCRADNSTGLKGVRARPCKTTPFQAVISVDGKSISLGYFASKEEAHAAYADAAQKFFGEFARV